MRNYHVRLPQYEGPLELLVHLIESQKFDIWDIPIARITDQYIAYLAQMDQLNLDIGGEFIVMAATLLAIKARMLMPEPPREEGAEQQDEPADPREVLARKLAEYKKFRKAAHGLDALLAQRGIVAGRGSPPPRGRVRYEPPAGKATTADLTQAFKQAIEALEAKTPEIVRPAPVEITVEERSEQLIARLREEMRIQFEALFGNEKCSRRYIVITFLAVLELVRHGLIVAEQNEPFGPIWLEQPQGGSSA